MICCNCGKNAKYDIHKACDQRRIKRKEDPWNHKRVKAKGIENSLAKTFGGKPKHQPRWRPEFSY